MHIRDLTQFLAELSENNNRAWFVMNKPRYDILRAEFLELVTKLIADISKFDPAVANCNPKKALFRINRDMRFSHDKSPYKTTFSAAITASGLKKPSQGGGPAYYFHIDADGVLLIAGGEYMPPSDRLRSIRQHVIADAAGFGKLLKNKKLHDAFGGLQEEGKLTRPPKGFEADAPHIEFIKLKSFIAWKETSLKKKIPTDLGKELVTEFKNAYPLITWLRQVK
ncbi:MAG: DUF2461 domain-containing protein [Burkholderiaceae bacterium]